MNRSFHAFAVLLVSLAGCMIAATWTSTLPQRRPQTHARLNRPAQTASAHCSCNPESLVRLEHGCACDKTTGELYGCGLGVGKNATAGKSVLGTTADSATLLLTKTTVSIRQWIAGFPWHQFAGQSQLLQKEIADLHAGFANLGIALEATPQRTQEQDYAAAELAAAGYDPDAAGIDLLDVKGRLSSLHRGFSPQAIRGLTNSTVEALGSLNRQGERQWRLWLVDNGLHPVWDSAEEAVMHEELVAGSRMQVDEEDFSRWFENFPPPLTSPNRLINPIEPKVDPEDSRGIILATAKALETLSGLLHQTAENLTRHAEQDVAELHKLKSGIEERR